MKRGFLLPAALVAAWFLISGAIVAYTQGSETTLGELKRIARIWDGTDVLLVGADGTITVQPGNTANTTAWLFKLDQTGANNDVDVLTLPSVTVGTFPDNEPFNLNQIVGAAPSATNPLPARLTDGTAFYDARAITSFPDNEPFNVAQWNGVTVLAGAGNTGTGSPRVTIASDNAPLTVRGANSNQQINCTDSVAIDTATSGNVELVALTGGQTIYVCGYNFIADGTVGVQFVSGTGTACATGETNETGVYSVQAREGIAYGGGQGMVFKGASGEAVCIELSAAVQVNGILTYTKF